MKPLPNSKKKILVIGDNGAGVTHQLGELTPFLYHWFSKVGEVTVREDYGLLTKQELDEFWLCVNYMERWDKAGSDRLAAAIISYVARGGRILTLHNGMITFSHYELEQLWGGRYIKHHAPYTCLRYKVTDDKGKDRYYTVTEEPYLIELNTLTPRETFLTFEYGDVDVAAGWWRGFGRGQVVVLTLGHHRRTFKSKLMNQVMVQSLKRLEVENGE
jgi:Trehalose utilisation.